MLYKETICRTIINGEKLVALSDGEKHKLELLNKFGLKNTIDAIEINKKKDLELDEVKRKKKWILFVEI